MVGLFRHQFPDGFSERTAQTRLQLECRIGFDAAKIQRRVFVAVNLFNDEKAFVHRFENGAITFLAGAQLDVERLHGLAGLGGILHQTERSQALRRRCIDCLHRLMGGRRKPAQTFQLPQVLGVELAALVVADRPEGADGFACYVKRNQQTLFDVRCRRQQIGVAPFDVPEQQRRVAVEHVAAGAEIARRAPADVRFPCAGDGGPEKALFVSCQQTEPRRTGLEDLQNRLDQRLQDRAGRVGKRLRQRHQCAVFRRVIRRPRRSPMQFLGIQDRFQGRAANFVGIPCRCLSFVRFHDLATVRRLRGNYGNITGF